ncbi:hypothetical protein E2C01_094390 [Portunus trituberculatus]|uniref:Uncharacterized protein n=1 Tax=Portunus trituberculatus TaxID=210409 RepID=A0A5B7K1J0_PORTR|nr:hypothetical protein [Portunus trituberculatus]
MLCGVQRWIWVRWRLELRLLRGGAGRGFVEVPKHSFGDLGAKAWEVDEREGADEREGVESRMAKGFDTGKREIVEESEAGRRAADGGVGGNDDLGVCVLRSC